MSCSHIAGGCYHLVGRELERHHTVGDDADKLDFPRTLGVNLVQSQIHCLAWAVISNHNRMLVRADAQSMNELMVPLTI
jgi:hypothetical protein